MTTFDQILPIAGAELRVLLGAGANHPPLYINRDLNGRVRLIVGYEWEEEPHGTLLRRMADALAVALGPHAGPRDTFVIQESDPASVCGDAPTFALEGLPNVMVVDRLADNSTWAKLSPQASGAPRIVFFSIKGGVGRSTALAASAWALANEGRRVMVLDLDLESPGLSSALLPEDRRPTFGIADWLVEDLVDNGETVLVDMVAKSTLAREGDILVVPAHGRDPGEYVSKLGRAWMSKRADGGVETWSRRLNRLIGQLEAQWSPDVILVDSRSGIDDVASSCVTDLGAMQVLLFAIDGAQTWTGYRLLFQYWKRMEIAEAIRDRLQVVGAMIPDQGASAYFKGLLERSHDLFAEQLYDAIQPPSLDAIGPDPEDPGAWKVDQWVDGWNFSEGDEGAPHFPLGIRWNLGFSALQSFHDRLQKVDPEMVMAVFGKLISHMARLTSGEGGGHA